MTTTKSYDFLNRLSQISSVPSASSAVSFSYLYNNANLRIRCTLADGSIWVYEYDPLGQVKSGKKFWPDWTPVAGQQFEYGFDHIAESHHPVFRGQHQQPKRLTSRRVRNSKSATMKSDLAVG